MIIKHRGGSPGVIGAGSLRDVGEEGVEGGIHKLRGQESREIGKIVQHCTIFHNRKSTLRQEPLWKGVGVQDTASKNRSPGSPPPPPPPPHPPTQQGVVRERTRCWKGKFQSPLPPVIAITGIYFLATWLISHFLHAPALNMH